MADSNFTWTHESPAHWDEGKRRIVGGAPEGVFDFAKNKKDGDLLEGDWWRVERDGAVIGYGWMESTWGDAEMLLAVDPEVQKQGIGTWILDQLEHEARERGLNYLYNVVPKSHPQREAVSQWLKKRKFEAAGDDGETLRRNVTQA